jgi:hypothetical protein
LILAASLDVIDDFSRTAREGLRLESGGYRRDHLRAFAQRVEVADNEVRIPRGIGVTSIRHLPTEWPKQHAALGLKL